MAARRIAIVYGIVYMIIGIFGIIPAQLTPPTTPLTINVLTGNLFGLFPVNVVVTVVHLVLGVWGISAYGAGFESSRFFARVAGVILIVLAIFGLIPGLNTLFGLAPLYGADVWLHLISGVVALYFGLTAREPVETVTPPNPPSV